MSKLTKSQECTHIPVIVVRFRLSTVYSFVYKYNIIMCYYLSTLPNHIFCAFSGNLSGAAGLTLEIELSADRSALLISFIFCSSVTTTALYSSIIYTFLLF
nr:MAG TPA: hypothetical protein [Bacteriophage sp.]